MKTTLYRYGRAVIYLLVDKIGFGASILGAMMFIGGPILWHQEKISHSFFNGALLVISTLIVGGIGIALYFLHEHLMVRWRDEI